MDIIDELDRRKEGLRALAHIMAEAYRNGKTFRGVKQSVISHDEVEGKMECDPKTNRIRYTETVGTDLLRGKSQRLPV